MRAILAFLIIACLIQSGCSHEKRKIRGQVFIVTEGEQNIKLGLVSIFVFSRAAVEPIMAARQKQSAELSSVLRSKLADSYATARRDLAAYRVSHAAAQQGLYDTAAPYYAAIDARDKKATHAMVSEIAQVRETFNLLQGCNSGLYFFSVLPLKKMIAKAETDADGRFELFVPQSVDLVIAALATRKIGAGKSERYFWVVAIPVANTGEELGPTMLSNNNLSDVPVGRQFIKTEAIEAPPALSLSEPPTGGN